MTAVDLDSFVKTTGGAGLHVVVPIVPDVDWSRCLEFSRGLSAAIERSDPDAFTTKFAKAGRESKILLDFMRNNRTNTSIAAYSSRARPNATVSVPLEWTELNAALDPQSFTIETVQQRLKRLRRDPWKDYWTVRQRLSESLIKAVGGSA